MAKRECGACVPNNSKTGARNNCLADQSHRVRLVSQLGLYRLPWPAGAIEPTALRGCCTDNPTEWSCWFLPLQNKQEDWVSLRSRSREPVRRINGFELKSDDCEGTAEFPPLLPLLAGFFWFLKPLNRLAPTRPRCLSLGPLLAWLELLLQLAPYSSTRLEWVPALEIPAWSLALAVAPLPAGIGYRRNSEKVGRLLTPRPRTSYRQDALQVGSTGSQWEIFVEDWKPCCSGRRLLHPRRQNLLWA
jgi:hypothetical protein